MKDTTSEDDDQGEVLHMSRAEAARFRNKVEAIFDAFGPPATHEQIERLAKEPSLLLPEEEWRVVPMGPSKLGLAEIDGKAKPDDRSDSFANIRVLTFTNNEDLEESLRRDHKPSTTR